MNLQVVNVGKRFGVALDGCVIRTFDTISEAMALIAATREQG